jgi:hypothetical protein
MRKIKSRSSLEILFLPTRFLPLEIYRQHIWNPAPCQRVTVFGVTIISRCFQLD